MSEPMTDTEFLSYCMTHSDTPRALFSAEQVARCLRLAGYEDTAKTWDAAPAGTWKSCDLSDLVREAWQRRKDA